ncbi:unnamed protein product [Blepharisma stoltei]|uniref:Uncharacterized protein n=1 Tax=Blepharisma stoltei TaxID=1481888 RepID=A0AAU9IUA7_9CILI|nr:unnamed protein product [Blepharisma stoltei]
MEISEIEAQLKEIFANITKDSYLLRLQRILTSEETVKLIKSYPSAKNLLDMIYENLQKSLLPSSLYSLILSLSSHIPRYQAEIGRARSIHDLKGNFLWYEQGCKELFNSPNKTLKRLNLFHLMDTRSKRYLYMKHGKYLLQDTKQKVITYMLSDRKTTLSSRVTMIIYSYEGKNKEALLFETRKSKHLIANHSEKHEEKAFEERHASHSQSPIIFYADATLFTPSVLSAQIDKEISLFKNSQGFFTITDSENLWTRDTIRPEDLSFTSPDFQPDFKLPCKRSMSNIIISEFY